MNISDVISAAVQEEIRKVLALELAPAIQHEVRAAFARLAGAEAAPTIVSSVHTDETSDEKAERMQELRKAHVATHGPVRVTVAEAATQCKVTPKAIYNAIAAGKLKAHKVAAPPGMKRGPKDGKLILIDVESLDAWRD